MMPKPGPPRPDGSGAFGVNVPATGSNSHSAVWAVYDIAGPEATGEVDLPLPRL